MSDFPDQPFGDDFDSEDDYRDEATRPMDSTPPRRVQPPIQPTPPVSSNRPGRRLPTDDLPPARSRPVLSQDNIPAPRTSRPVTPPVTSRSYNDQDEYNTADYQTQSYPTSRKGSSGARSRKSAAPSAVVNKRESGLYLPWWSLLIMIAFVGAASVGAWIIVDRAGGNAVPGGTPQVIVITATFTVGPPPTTTPIQQAPTLTPLPALPTIVPTASLPPGNFIAGASVKVVGVGQVGLNVRNGPGRDAVVKFQAAENEVFQLKETPQTASGDEWWFIKDPKDANRGGWASRQYLQVLSP